MNTLIVIFSLYLASLAFVRLRNRESFPLIRQLSDFSVFMVPFNIPAYLLSKVPTSPFIETRHFRRLYGRPGREDLRGLRHAQGSRQAWWRRYSGEPG